jgi:hypothetical protein
LSNTDAETPNAVVIDVEGSGSVEVMGAVIEKSSR